MKNFFLTLCLALLLALLGACNKSDVIGTDILPADDIPGLIITDTSTVVTFALRDDSIKSGGVTNKSLLTSLNPIGMLNDPIFGTTNAHLFAQLDLSKTSFDFGTNFSADSLVLTLAYKEYFGDTTSPVTFRVFRINENISADSVYFTSKDYFTYNATELGSATITLHPKDSTTEYGIKKAPHIRIPMGTALLNEFALKVNTNEMKDNAAFISFFKGIYITAETSAGKGFVMATEYKSSMSRLALYYKNDAADSSLFAFTFNDYNRVNRYKHDYSSTALALQLNDSTMGTDYAYIQSLGGVMTKVKFPYVKQIAQGRQLSVNRALLYIPAADDYAPAFKVHSTLATLNADGGNNLVDKYKFAIAPYDSAKDQYVVDITYYMQQVMNGKHTDYGLLLKGSGALVNAYRTRVSGGDNVANRMKLKLYFTEY